MKPLSQPVSTDLKAITKQLQSNYKATAKQLQSNCKAITSISNVLSKLSNLLSNTDKSRILPERGWLSKVVCQQKDADV